MSLKELKKRLRLIKFVLNNCKGEENYTSFDTVYIIFFGIRGSD